jgi:hypothetical protein
MSDSLIAFLGGRGHTGRVLPLAAGIGEAEIDELDVLFLDQREYLLGVHFPYRPSRL